MYIVQSYRGRTQSLVTKNKDISENRASRNFDLMITQMMSDHNSSDLAPDQASVFMAMTFEQQQFRPRTTTTWRLLKITLQAPFLNVQMTSVHISSGLVFHQMTSDHNRSKLGIQDHSNEPSSSKLVPKVVPLAVKKATSRQELQLLFHHHISMLRTT
ncbi:hypothetical protein Tco_1350414, partial [Tanacetum coccineum]